MRRFVLQTVPVDGRTLFSAITLSLLLVGCDKPAATNKPGRDAEVELREGQAVAKRRPTPLYRAKFVIRGLAADGDNLYVSGLRLPTTKEGEPDEQGLPTGTIVKVSLLGLPEVLAEGDFIPMNRLALIDGQLYWHERHDSPSGRGLRSISTEGGEIQRISDFAGNSWVIRDDVVYFTRPDDEIDEGGFYQLARTSSGKSKSKPKPKLAAKRSGVVRALLEGPDRKALYWITRQRKNGTWGVYEWDGERSGTELMRSDETFASITVDGEDFLWVTWADDEGQPLHSLYRRPIHGGDTQVLARKLGMPGFMEVFADEQHVYLTTVEGGELRRLARGGGEVEVLEGTGDRLAVANRFNLFWVDEQQVYWRGK